MSEDTKGIKRIAKSKDKKYNGKMKKKNTKISNDQQKRITTRTPEKKQGLNPAIPGERQFLLYVWHLSCYFCIWPRYIAWTRWTLRLTWSNSISIYLNTLISFPSYGVRRLSSIYFSHFDILLNSHWSLGWPSSEFLLWPYSISKMTTTVA